MSTAMRTPVWVARAGSMMRSTRRSAARVTSPTGRCSPASLRTAAAAPLGSRSSMGCMRLPLTSFASSPHRRTTHTQAAVAPDVMSVDEAAATYGFETIKTEFIAEYNSHATLFRHTKTGAELMSLVNDDENKTFGAVFRTPPANSTGIPHILEHSVLCGSRKYPIKEPFVELMKGSLNTFLNAFTYPDRTCYPVASCNLQDFYNLVDVYLDAVLHPTCVADKQVFEQEGWHYELEDPADDITLKGVVFNEMKGVYSSPDSVLGRECQRVLFPDNTYGVDSGGDPAAIPSLTFEEFQEFHAQFYHPTNGRFWFYGDDDPAERLRILDGYLSEFSRRDSDSSVKVQSRFTEPKYMVEKYAASADSDEEPKTFLAVNWLLSEERFDVETELAFSFLNFLMLGTPAAPLRKALESSGLGEALVGGGLEDELRQPTFTIGLKGVKGDNVAKVETLVMDTLKQLRRDGFDAEAVEAAVNTIEFSLRENNTGRFPRGLSLMLRSMSTWLYDADPFEPMKYADSLDAFKAKLAAGEDVFGPLLDKYLLSNTHRVTLELQPDSALAAAQEAAEKAKIEAFRATLDADGIQRVIDNTKALKLKQETPDPAELLRCMPALSLSDIPQHAQTTPIAVESKGDGSTILRHDLFTNDVLYVEALFDMRAVAPAQLPLVPLFCRCLTNMGTQALDFVQLTQKIGRKTGGISVYPSISNVRGEAEPLAHLIVKGKTTVDKADEMMDLYTEVLTTTNFDDKERFLQMVLETKAGMEARIVGGGHSVAAGRLDAMDSTAGYANELMGGVSYLQYLKQLTLRVEADWAGVKAELEAIRAAVLSRKGALVNVTADERTMTAADAAVSRFLESMPAVGGSVQPWAEVLAPGNEGLVVPTQVNYVAKGANLYKAGYELQGSAYVISKYLGTTWLWDRVRVSGGAYGGFCDFDSHSGMFTYLSYRDPNLLGTLDNYDGTGDFLRSLEMDKEELSNAIIGCVGDIDAYQLPDAKGYQSLMRYLLKVEDSERQERREQILGTTVADFKAFADSLEAVKTSGQIVAVASADAVAKANAKRPGLLTVRNIL